MQSAISLGSQILTRLSITGLSIKTGLSTILVNLVEMLFLGMVCDKRSLLDPLFHTQFLKRNPIPSYLELPFTLPGGFQITKDSTLWKKSDSFRASHPLLLERIGKVFESFCYLLEIHGALTGHLIKAINSSYVMAHKTDLLDDAYEEGREKEKALQHRVKEMEEQNENLKVVPAAMSKEKKKATAQAMAEIRKHDVLQARFTRLEGEHFELSSRLTRLQLIQSQEAKRANEANG
ncbi:hypothetical protein LIER_13938 [Lithospermum erythrorhizon]|uniref:Uncharacterized protein n=1 Tax=Lithospermum erythrorhizon TaxID=34254 RepID=A0AAV3PZI4_LITER